MADPKTNCTEMTYETDTTRDNNSNIPHRMLGSLAISVRGEQRYIYNRPCGVLQVQKIIVAAANVLNVVNFHFSPKTFPLHLLQ